MRRACQHYSLGVSAARGGVAGSSVGRSGGLCSEWQWSHSVLSRQAELLRRQRVHWSRVCPQQTRCQSSFTTRPASARRNPATRRRYDTSQSPNPNPNPVRHAMPPRIHLAASCIGRRVYNILRVLPFVLNMSEFP